MTEAIVLCADDYALTPGTSRAILALADAGRISAFSCMTASPLWPEHGKWLAPLKDKVDIGLHLTLVDEKPLTAMPKTCPDGRLPSITSLIAKSYAFALDLDEIGAEIDAQISAFIAVTSRAPSHIDGHLHAHVLPGIRELMWARANVLTPRPWFRNVHEPLRRITGRGVAITKAAFIAALGRPFEIGARAFRIPVNGGFSGIYGFPRKPRDYGALLDRFLRDLGPRPLILCHPGEKNDTAAWSGQRAAEFDYLSSPAFHALLQNRGLTVSRFAP